MRFRVTKESHPVRIPLKIAVWLAAVSKINPFHSKGRSVLHTEESVELAKVGFTVIFNVAKESHPV